MCVGIVSACHRCAVCRCGVCYSPVHPLCAVPREAWKGHHTPWSSVTGSCKAPNGCLGSNSALWESSQCSERRRHDLASPCLPHSQAWPRLSYLPRARITSVSCPAGVCSAHSESGLCAAGQQSALPTALQPQPHTGLPTPLLWVVLLMTSCGLIKTRHGKLCSASTPDS